MTETIRTNEKFAANMMQRIPLKRWADGRRSSVLTQAAVFAMMFAGPWMLPQLFGEADQTCLYYRGILTWPGSSIFTPRQRRV